MAVDTWTEPRVTHLKAMFDDGYSCSDMAAELGNDITRNAVIGKLHRMGSEYRRGQGRLPSKAKPRGPRGPQKPRAPDARTIRAKPHRSPQEEVQLRCAEVDPLNLTLHELTDQTCKFPYGEAAPYAFCGHPVFDRSYCGAHFFLSVRPSSERRTSA